MKNDHKHIFDEASELFHSYLICDLVTIFEYKEICKYYYYYYYAYTDRRKGVRTHLSCIIIVIVIIIIIVTVIIILKKSKKNRFFTHDLGYKTNTPGFRSPQGKTFLLQISLLQ
jgi:hypothetical protein